MSQLVLSNDPFMTIPHIPDPVLVLRTLRRQLADNLIEAKGYCAGRKINNLADLVLMLPDCGHDPGWQLAAADRPVVVDLPV
ncbi:hypothetical protein N826_04400 [Skermanella aerolata KACC 11604]|nr:hypothetical protein N826_04400 [Skermanella aerolata KACC 11604]